MTWRLFIALHCLALSSGCVTFSDGAFQQIEGRFFDARQVEEVVDGRTSEEEILEWFGLPNVKSSPNGGSKVFEYYSVRARTSIERRLLLRKYHRQTVTESMTIRIVDGRVASHKYHSQVSEE